MKNYKFKINGNNYSVDINEVEGQEIKLEVNGTPYTVTVDKEMRAQRPRTTTIINNNNAAPRVSAAAGDVQRSSAPRPGSAAGGTKVTSPLPGTILGRPGQGRPDSGAPRSHEDGEQYRVRYRRYRHRSQRAQGRQCPRRRSLDSSKLIWFIRSYKNTKLCLIY